MFLTYLVFGFHKQSQQKSVLHKIMIRTHRVDQDPRSDDKHFINNIYVKNWTFNTRC